MLRCRASGARAAEHINCPSWIVSRADRQFTANRVHWPVPSPITTQNQKETTSMPKQFIQQNTRLFADNSATTSENSRLNVPHQARNNGQSNGVKSRHRQNGSGGFHRREPDIGYRHDAERLLRDGHFRIAIAGFSDTAFNINVMSRHDSPQLALAVSDLPCKIKRVDQRNIAAGLLAAIETLDDGAPGRRGIVLITSGNAASGQDQLQQLAAKAAGLRIAIHVICLGIRPNNPIGARGMSTREALGYGSFRMADTASVRGDGREIHFLSHVDCDSSESRSQRDGQREAISGGTACSFYRSSCHPAAPRPNRGFEFYFGLSAPKRGSKP